MSPRSKKQVLAALFGIVVLIPLTAAAQWEKRKTGTLAWLKAIYFLDSKSGWAAGSRGTLLSTQNGGDSWEIRKVHAEDNILDVYFTDSLTGWLLCGRDAYSLGTRSPTYIMRTVDGGGKWERIELPENADRLVRFVFRNDSLGFAIGEAGSIWQLADDQLVDGRKTWKRVNRPSRYLLLGGQFKDDLNAILVGGGGTFLSTATAGADWDASFSQTRLEGKLSSVFFADQKNGWIVGSGGAVYVTRNGGRSWTAQISGTKSDLFGVHFLDSKRGIVVGDAGTALFTEDSGEHWNRTDTGFKGRLERVAAVGDRLFAVGSGGTLITMTIDR